MKSSAVYVGLDYHQMQVCILDAEGCAFSMPRAVHSRRRGLCILDAEGKVLLNRKLENRVARVAAAVERFEETPTAAVEACCGAAGTPRNNPHGLGPRADARIEEWAKTVGTTLDKRWAFIEATHPPSVPLLRRSSATLVLGGPSAAR